MNDEQCALKLCTSHDVYIHYLVMLDKIDIGLKSEITGKFQQKLEVYDKKTVIYLKYLDGDKHSVCLA